MTLFRWEHGSSTRAGLRTSGRPNSRDPSPHGEGLSAPLDEAADPARRPPWSNGRGRDHGQNRHSAATRFARFDQAEGTNTAGQRRPTRTKTRTSVQKVTGRRTAKRAVSATKVSSRQAGIDQKSRRPPPCHGEGRLGPRAIALSGRPGRRRRAKGRGTSGVANSANSSGRLGRWGSHHPSSVASWGRAPTPSRRSTTNQGHVDVRGGRNPGRPGSCS